MSALLLIALGAGFSASEPDPLLAALRERYPRVARFEIKPFATRGEVDVGAAQIVKLGARSALRSGGRVYWYAVSGFQDVVTAVRALRTGESLDATVGRVVERDVLAAACEPVTELESLAGMRTRRVLRPDQIICTTAVEPRPPVARGDGVTVHYLGTGFTLTTRGIAVSDGRLGEALDIRNPQSKELFRAVVSGTREVTIHE